MNLAYLSRSKRQEAGFTLIEMIGVLSIMAILAAVMMPDLIKQIDAAHADAETQTLKTLTLSMEQYIKASKAIPSAVNWAQLISSYSDAPASRISRNQAGFMRRLYIDPRFMTTQDSAFAGYTQTSGLMKAPVSPRLMIVSNLHADVPPQPAGSAAFHAIWEQQPGALLIESGDVKIKRLHLGYLFHHVLLTNKSTVSPSYQLEAGVKGTVPQAVGGSDGSIGLYIIDGSKLSLFLDPTQGGGLNHSLLFLRDASFMYGTDGIKWFWGHP